MKRFLCAAVVALIVVAFAVPAFAQEAGAKFATHIQSHATKATFICGANSPADTTTSPATPCSDYVTGYPLLTGGDLYVVIAQADSDGVSACSFGLEYTEPTGVGVDVINWTPCITGLGFESDTWPESGSGARLTWLNDATCPDQVIGDDGAHAVAGAFYVYAYTEDIFSLTPNRTLTSGDELAIANCLGAEILFDTENVQRAGWVEFGGTQAGCNPCVEFCPTPVEKSTWGKIKNRYVKN